MGTRAGQESGPRARVTCTGSLVANGETPCRGCRGATGRRGATRCPHCIGAAGCTSTVTPGAGAMAHAASRGVRAEVTRGIR